jgi:hypothetical protein
MVIEIRVRFSLFSYNVKVSFSLQNCDLNICMKDRNLYNAAHVILRMKLLLSSRRSFPAFVGSGTSVSRMPFPTGDVRQRQFFIQILNK